MNPACKENINSDECQKWINDVFVHCNRLTVDRTLQFWDNWWLTEEPVPFYHEPTQLSAYDCQRLRKQIAREVAAAKLTPDVLKVNGIDPGCQIMLLLVVVCLTVGLIGGIVWLLNTTLLRLAQPCTEKCECKRKYCGRRPRSFISFGDACHPATQYGPYRNSKIIVPKGTCRVSRI